ncbi:testis-specific serine/threonine-protein kinase 4-like [Schistocerca piceifrons]|uniref:testis-specific serine/threonine-protein kinase 4-like n=1 Tax=Schistocerca piceifrons TaxID=274613 RepID=UPI001F5ECD53|nr:testis-specific serine/threonine-protein kinase 4-like [Schistocerca piceifrons]
MFRFTDAAAEAPAADPEPQNVVAGVRGTVLERHGYTVGRSIGSGSYATVKIAHSDRHDREVAIKIVSKFRAPKDYLRKFLPREIEVVKGLRHKNLIRFYQAIETTHRVYIVMEYAPNGSLLEVIRRESYIKEPRARVWFRQLVDAVEYCHNQGVVHRDIKCENLLLDEEMNVRLSDFGFARGRMKARDRQPPPMSETFCGSYAYAAPEILRGTPYRPQLSDIWSMGVVLYAMIYGRLPFDDSNYTQLLKQVQSKVMFPRQPRASAAVRSLITRILSPARTRLRIPDIRADVWMAPGTDDAAAQQDEIPVAGVCREAAAAVATTAVEAAAVAAAAAATGEESAPVAQGAPAEVVGAAGAAAPPTKVPEQELAPSTE